MANSGFADDHPSGIAIADFPLWASGNFRAKSSVIAVKKLFRWVYCYVQAVKALLSTPDAYNAWKEAEKRFEQPQKAPEATIEEEPKSVDAEQVLSDLSQAYKTYHRFKKYVK